MNSTTRRTVFITGATSGIGKACAYAFAEAGCQLILVGRREERLHTIADELSREMNVGVTTFCMDVRDREAVTVQLADFAKENDIDILVNNAGLARGRDFFDDAQIDDWEEMIDTNVKGLLYVSKALMPALIRSKGHIINVGSTAAKEVYEQGNVYCATKSAVDALSKAMRIDLLRHGMKVTAIHPGAVETEFSEVRYHGDAEKAKKVYQGYQPLTAQHVADTIKYVAELPANVCINDLVITALAQANSFYLAKS